MESSAKTFVRFSALNWYRQSLNCPSQSQRDSLDSYHMFGIRSEIPVMPAIKLLWEMRTPFGTPVDPLVYMMTATSEGNGDLRSRATVIITEKIAQTQATCPTPGAGKAAGMNVSAVEVFKDSGKNVFAEKRSSDVSRQKEKRTTGCGAGAASGIC